MLAGLCLSKYFFLVVSTLSGKFLQLSSVANSSISVLSHKQGYSWKRVKVVIRVMLGLAESLLKTIRTTDEL